MKTLPATESIHPNATDIDLLTSQQTLELCLASQLEALESVRPQFASISQAVDAMRNTVTSGGRLIYVAAGTSAIMALSEALELPYTFGIASKQIVTVFAGGSAAVINMPAESEDDTVAAEARITELNVGTNDCMIGLAASGTTPFTLAALALANSKSATTIGISNNPQTALTNTASIAIALATPPEIVAGSTRLGAATAQKATLNLLSTLLGIKLGHVVDGMMVNHSLANRKLRERAIRTICKLADCKQQLAEDCLFRSNDSIKPAVLLALGIGNLVEAEKLLQQYKGNLRNSMANI